MLEKMMIPGKIENIIMICDMADTNIFSLNYSLLTGIIKFMTNALKGINRNFIILNAPLTFAMISKVVNVFLDETTKKKIILTGESTVPDEIKELIHPKMLEKKYGGEAENRETNFWPPQLACDPSDLN